MWLCVCGSCVCGACLHVCVHVSLYVCVSLSNVACVACYVSVVLVCVQSGDAARDRLGAMGSAGAVSSSSLFGAGRR
ncbi:MAG: hypothetical protein P4L40_25095 [Terracidiphilus sp.]|nr:hypothetical protein [Terracidiphilus sp.]